MNVGVGTTLKGTVSAVVTRADGTVEDLGIIAETSQPVTPGLLKAFRAAWREGWDEGKKRREN